MAPDAMFWLALATKMAVTAAFLVAATLVAERAGPLVGGLVATLPISAGPAYAFLSLDHDAAFIAASATASLATNAVTGLFALCYMILAQVRGPALSLAGALGSWFLLAFLVRSVEWTLAGALALNAAAYLVCLPAARWFRSASFRPPRRRWYDVPLRAVLVALLVASVIGLSARVGPAVTGTLAVFPMVLTSLILIFHPRIGGPATAALIANTLPGLVGFAFAVLALHLAAVPLGAPAALLLALAVSVAWNLMLWIAHKRGWS